MSEHFHEVFLAVLGSTLRVSTPLLLAALGGLLCEKSGVINIGLEGMMLMGAFAGASLTYSTHSPWFGAFAAMGAGFLVAAFYGLFVIRLRADQIVAGTAINMLAAGAAPFLSKILFGSTGSTPTIPLGERFQSAPIWFAWTMAIAVFFWLKYTAPGLWLQFAGEHPEALESAGIRVKRVRWFAVLMSGILAGLGGASLSIFLSSSYSRNMTAGRGFMAVAALIFGKWRPIPTALACLFFGFADALQIRLQGVVCWGHESVPVQFIQIFPYVVTILVLAGFVGKARAPRSLGIPIMLFLALGLSGCETADFPEQLSKEWNALMVVATGGRSPLAKKADSPVLSDVERKHQMNAELLHELFLVVFQAEPKNRSQFGTYLNVLNQGASLEGIHNGMTHSSEYRELENTHSGSTPQAVQIFSEELVALEVQLPAITVFDENSAKPLSHVEMPTGSEEISMAPAPVPIPGSSVHRKEKVEAYAALFQTASIFTLKRLFCEEAIKVIESKESSPEALIAWYGQWAASIATRKVDFGIPMRNKSDEEFHKNWARTVLSTDKVAGVDRLTWEVLNRIHRVLNASSPK